jgi:flagellar motor switch protein FliN
MRLSDVVALIPGAIIELPKNSEEELQLLVNNKPIASGAAVKVGENFGLRITFVGDLRERIGALGAAPDGDAGAGGGGGGGAGGDEESQAAALAEAMLSGRV